MPAQLARLSEAGQTCARHLIDALKEPAPHPSPLQALLASLAPTRPAPVPRPAPSSAIAIAGHTADLIGLAHDRDVLQGMLDKVRCEQRGTLASLNTVAPAWATDRSIPPCRPHPQSERTPPEGDLKLQHSDEP